MSLPLGSLFHWSPSTRRQRIIRRGLRPTTATAVWVRPTQPGVRVGHFVEDLPEETVRTVCLGTSPSTAWALSGAISALQGESWDLWEISLHDDDEVHLRPMFGSDLDEVRVANRIPRSRVWLVGTRKVGRLHWHADAS